MTFPLRLEFALPAWVSSLLPAEDTAFASLESRMGLVVALAEANVDHRTGGPFAAAVFDGDGRLVSVGVNCVVQASGSIWHAEIAALALAQRARNTFDLGTSDASSCELVTSTEPCAMCLGAIPWSGVRHLVCGARGEDAEAIGMDEGAKPADWPDALRRRGITVTRDVCRDAAVAVLQRYAAGGGVIYNGRQGG